MNFLKKLFGGSSKPQNPAGQFYVRPKRCNEIVPVRVDLYNEPSQSDDGTYFVRKVVRGARCPFPAELLVYMDARRNVVTVEVEDGEKVTAEEYQTWVAEKGK